MKFENHRRSLELTLLGLVGVLFSAVFVVYFTSDTEAGKLIRFIVPLLVGMVFGIKIYLMELKKVNEKAEQKRQDFKMSGRI